MLLTTFLLHGCQYLIEWNGSEAGGVIGQTIRNDQFAVMEESTAGINDVGYVTFAFALVGFKQGFAETADHFRGIIAVEEERADTVLSHGADTVAEDQPACIGLDGGSAVAQSGLVPMGKWV